MFRGKSLQDILAALPLEVLTLVVKIPSLKRFQVFMLFRCNKILRVARLDQHISAFDAMYAWAMSNGRKNELKVSKLFATIMIVAHWLGCIFFFLAYIQNDLGMSNWADCSATNPANRFFPCPNVTDMAELEGMLTNFDPENLDALVNVTVSYSTTDRFIRSLYWASTALTTAGYGDISATTTIERAFSIFTLVMGILLFSTVIANLEEIVAQLDVTSTLFQQKMDNVKLLMQVREIPLEIEEEIMQ